MSKKLQFQGDLQETPVSDMLSTIVRNQLPGVVEVARDGMKKKLFIHEGHILHAASSDRSDRLGSLELAGTLDWVAKYRLLDAYREMSVQLGPVFERLAGGEA